MSAPNEKIPVSFSISKDLLERVKVRLGRRYGDKSKLVVRLLEMFCDGEVKVTLPSRRL